MTIKAVVFDLDGTIATFNLDYKRVRAEARAFLLTEGLSPLILSENESIFEMLKKAELFLKNSDKPAEEFRRIRERVLAIAEKHEVKAAKETDLFPRVKETLSILRTMGLRIGLCTINCEKATNCILERFKIASLFDAIVPRNNVASVKPNVEHLEAVVDALNVRPCETIVVGDGLGDMKCAKKLGAIALGLVSDPSSKTKLMEAGADYLITEIAELPTTVECVNRLSPIKK
jgi:HAD superfamily hydrolase (TIGR01549 family)